MVFLKACGEPFGIVEQLVATGLSIGGHWSVYWSVYWRPLVALSLLRLVRVKTKTRLLRKTDKQYLGDGTSRTQTLHHLVTVHL